MQKSKFSSLAPSALARCLFLGGRARKQHVREYVRLAVSWNWRELKAFESFRTTVVPSNACFLFESWALAMYSNHKNVSGSFQTKRSQEKYNLSRLKLKFNANKNESRKGNARGTWEDHEKLEIAVHLEKSRKGRGWAYKLKKLNAKSGLCRFLISLYIWKLHFDNFRVLDRFEMLIAYNDGKECPISAEIWISKLTLHLLGT